VDLGSFTSGLLTGLREGVEAALIVSIVITYLVRTGNGALASRIWVGTGLAILVSAALGLILFTTVGAFVAPYEQIFEGSTMLLAAGVVTWMLFWMRRQAAGVKGALQAAVDRVLDTGGAWGLALLAFTAVIREGVETSLFLVGQATIARARSGRSTRPATPSATRPSSSRARPDSARSARTRRASCTRPISAVGSSSA
jgi:FTR1 family protein